MTLQSFEKYSRCTTPYQLYLKTVYHVQFSQAERTVNPAISVIKHGAYAINIKEHSTEVTTICKHFPLILCRQIFGISQLVKNKTSCLMTFGGVAIHQLMIRK